MKPDYNLLLKEYEKCRDKTYRSMYVDLKRHIEHIHPFKKYFKGHEPGVYLKNQNTPTWPYALSYIYKDRNNEWRNVEKWNIGGDAEYNSQYFEYFKRLVLNYDVKEDRTAALIKTSKTCDFSTAVSLLPFYSKHDRCRRIPHDMYIDHTMCSEDPESMYMFLQNYISRWYFSMQVFSSTIKVVDDDTYMSGEFETLSYIEKRKVTEQIEEKLLSLETELYSIYPENGNEETPRYSHIGLDFMPYSTIVTLGEDHRVLSWYRHQLAELSSDPEKTKDNEFF